MTEATHTVLIVEDEPAARRLLKEAAAETAFPDPEFATRVAEALEYFPTVGENDSKHDVAPPDLLLLDLDLPGENGTVLLEELKTSSTSIRRIPVLILSSSSDQATIDHAYDLGANAYLQKPDSYGDVLTLLQELRNFWLSRIQQPSY